jgi:alpha-amylase
MERPGLAGGHPVRIRKSIELAAGTAALLVRYELSELPLDVCLHFAVELNLAAMAGHAEDRYYVDSQGLKHGMLDARIDLPHTEGVALVDQWLDLSVGLDWSRTGGLWCHPIETVSQSESGFEGVYQSSAVIPHWHVTADESGKWEVQIGLVLEPFRTAEPALVKEKETLARV